TGIDAIAHGVETAGSTARKDISREFSKEAWNLLEPSFAPALNDSSAVEARQRMLLGAHLAGCAIENSMLGAAHALANPLTALFAMTHGVAVGLMLPHVVKFNCQDRENPYADLTEDCDDLVSHLQRLLRAANLPTRLSELSVTEDSLPKLAELAAKQWTAGYN